MSSEGERNKELFRRLLEKGFGEGNLDVVDEVVAAQYIEHQPGMPTVREGLKGVIQYLHGVYPDFRMVIEDMVADGDRVWGRMRASGTQLGPLMGHPPTGKTMEIYVLDVCRFADGEMVEHWGVPDRFSQLEQLGLLPQP